MGDLASTIFVNNVIKNNPKKIENKEKYLCCIFIAIIGVVTKMLIIKVKNSRNF